MGLVCNRAKGDFTISLGRRVSGDGALAAGKLAGDEGKRGQEADGMRD